MNPKNILWNLVGAFLPLATAALVIPGLLSQIGQERFGLLALAWGLIGYAGALDLGIGRATTQRIAALRIGTDRLQAFDIVATSVRLTVIAGISAAILILIATACGIYRGVNATSVPEVEIAISLALLAFALPIQALSSTYRGVNEAYLNFRSINLLRVFLGAANFGFPYVVAFYTTRLHWLVATLLLSRCIALVFYRVFAHRCLTSEVGHMKGRFVPDVARGLFEFGGWFTVSSVVSPLLVTADRFFVGAVLSASAVTLYVIPYELTVQTLFLVGAVTSVAFPTLTNLVQNAPHSANRVFRKWLLRVICVMLVVTIALALLIPFILRFWIGDGVQDVSILAGQVLCVGVFFNSIGAMYFSLLHAHGKTRVTALIHVLELPLFMAALYYLISAYGVLGAAVAWSARMVFDALALVVVARAIHKVARSPEAIAAVSR
jgi:O-antigen/teichoic acid export membrane protein